MRNGAQGLVPASAANVEKALAFLRTCDGSGASDLWGALMLTLSDPKVDTILVVGDGQPSGGVHSSLELIRDLLAHENRFRRVWIDAVIADAEPVVLERWREICSASGGRLVAVVAR